jgi:hypothetical protein
MSEASVAKPVDHVGQTGKPASVPWWRRKAVELWGIDPRSLALFRIAAALVLIFDLLQRLRDLDVFYVDDGIAPVELVRGDPLWHWSLHFLDGSPAFQAVLLALGIFFAVALLAGYRTRLATLCSWLLLASLHTRMPYVGNGGDLLLRLLLFWGMFVPLSRCWSVDALLRAWRGNAAGNSREDGLAPIASVGTAAMLIQLCCMYFFSGLYKLNADWLGADWLGGDALLWAMHFDYFNLPAAHVLAGHPALLQWLTLATVWLELLGPLLLFFPWQTGKIRLALLAAFAVMHLLIHFTLTVGLFSIVSMIGWLLFLPPGCWNSRPVTALGRLVAGLWPWGRLPVVGAPAVAEAPRPALRRRVSHIAVQALCGVLLVYVLFQNASPLAHEAIERAPQRRAWFEWATVPPRVEHLGQTLGLNQQWNMFRESPRRDGWYVARARLADGSLVDVLRNLPASDRKPELASAVFPNNHWRYYFHYLVDEEFAKFRRPAAEFLCRRWNAAHDKPRQIARLELDWFQDLSGPRDPAGEFASKHLAVIETESATPLDDLNAALRALQPEYAAPRDSPDTP